MDQLSDRDLVVRCLAAEKNAYADLIARYQRPLMAQLRGRLRDPRDAEEIAQEVFTRAYFSLGRLRNGDAFFSWLLAFANRVLLEHFRSRRRDRRIVELAAVDQTAKESGKTDHGSLERAISQLPDRCREVILLRYFAGLTCAEIAERLNLELGTVTKSLSRAYAMLREQLDASADQPARPEANP
jgi:RNA polymerase sigma-70 factor (ECF subfamily)